MDWNGLKIMMDMSETIEKLKNENNIRIDSDKIVLGYGSERFLKVIRIGHRIEKCVRISSDSFGLGCGLKMIEK